MKRSRRISALLLALVMTILMLGNNISVQAMEKNSIISGMEAQEIAITHIQSSLMLSENETANSWHWGIVISKPTAMYDIDNNISGYYFSLTDEQGGAAGYIIIGSNVSYAPVIEYSTSGTFYPAEAMETENLDTLYYNGGIDYLIGDGENYIDVTSFGKATDVTDAVKANKADKRSLVSNNDFSEEWIMWDNLLTNYGTYSNPPTSGGAITKPDDYETGYQTKTAKNVTSYGNTYKIMNNFSGYSNHCAPTAATNMMLYWYNRSSSTYSALRKDGDSTWTKTFARYHSLMGTTASGGTPNANLKDAYSTYLSDAGFSSSTVTYSSSASWSSMKTELDANYPFHLMVHGHFYYGDHSVVGLGYEEYKHGLLSYSRYIRLADGWSSSTDRFVHTSVGNSALRMVKVRPA